MPDHRPHPATRCAQALGHIDPATQAVTPPIHPATTYLRDADGGYRSGLCYARDDNPTHAPAERLLADLEGAADAALFASGMAAATTVFQALAPGGHVVLPPVMYWGLRGWALAELPRWGAEVTVAADGSAEALAAAIVPGRTRLVWIETPANPTWEVTDIAAIAAAAHAAGAVLAVDSTVATPIFCQPIAHGADIVMHAATKYLNGHSDVVAGALATARDDELWARIRRLRREQGAVLGPFDAWLLLRGMRTLELRAARAARSAMALALALSRDPHVAAALYPGLADFPGHAIAARQMAPGFGGMLSIRVAGGREAAIAVAAATKIWKRATSLGGVESLIEHRASIEGAGTPCPDDLLRLSVGIEDPDDLLADLTAALAAAHGR